MRDPSASTPARPCDLWRWTGSPLVSCSEEAAVEVPAASASTPNFSDPKVRELLMKRKVAAAALKAEKEAEPAPTKPAQSTIRPPQSASRPIAPTMAAPKNSISPALIALQPKGAKGKTLFGFSFSHTFV
jgi:hypothetical protein